MFKDIFYRISYVKFWDEWYSKKYFIQAIDFIFKMCSFPISKTIFLLFKFNLYEKAVCAIIRFTCI